MSAKKAQDKPRLHRRNKNKNKYDLNALIESNPELREFIKPNKYGNDSVDFANPDAVRILNKAILNHYYGIKNWDFPKDNLCPPIPGRADYIHHIADLITETNFNTIAKDITCLDVGVGASCIYPILGVTEYNWNFIASDINQNSLDSSEKIIKANESLANKIDCRLQENPKDYFYGIIDREDKIDISICNPPFHSSTEEAQTSSRRKRKNLSGKKEAKPKLNFAGISNELICEGGESKFIQNMIKESKKFGNNFFWFTTLVSKQSNLKGIYKLLETLKASQVKTIPLGTGNKSSRIVAWCFLTEGDQKEWKEERWSSK